MTIVIFVDPHPPPAALPLRLGCDYDVKGGWVFPPWGPSRGRAKVGPGSSWPRLGGLAGVNVGSSRCRAGGGRASEASRRAAWSAEGPATTTTTTLAQVGVGGCGERKGTNEIYSILIRMSGLPNDREDKAAESCLSCKRRASPSPKDVQYDIPCSTTQGWRTGVVGGASGREATLRRGGVGGRTPYNWQALFML